MTGNCFWHQELFVAKVEDLPSLQMFGNIVMNSEMNVLFDMKSMDEGDFELVMESFFSALILNMLYHEHALKRSYDT